MNNSINYGLLDLSAPYLDVSSQDDQSKLLDIVITHSGNQEKVINAITLQRNSLIKTVSSRDSSIASLSINLEATQRENVEVVSELTTKTTQLKESTKREELKDLQIAELQRKLNITNREEIRAKNKKAHANPLRGSIEEVFAVRGIERNMPQPKLSKLRVIRAKLYEAHGYNNKGQESFSVRVWQAAYNIDLVATLSK